ncbi:MAG: ATP-binding cassette domain-containing protein, partial [Anaerolineales bacterium]|nr:ATP-binding cassette domain-containing protein [Anaerolineales bacterium]
MSTIRFDDVTKQFANAPRPAVDRCRFEVAEGSFVVLLGPSGCGKTTLLKMVNRLYEPTSGTIFLGDTDITQTDATLLRRQIGYVIQQIGLFPHMTVRQNISIVPDLLGWPEARQRQRV